MILASSHSAAGGGWAKISSKISMASELINSGKLLMQVPIARKVLEGKCGAEPLRLPKLVELLHLHPAARRRTNRMSHYYYYYYCVCIQKPYLFSMAVQSLPRCDPGQTCIYVLLLMSAASPRWLCGWTKWKQAEAFWLVSPRWLLPLDRTRGMTWPSFSPFQQTSSMLFRVCIQLICA